MRNIGRGWRGRLGTWTGVSLQIHARKRGAIGIKRRLGSGGRTFPAGYTDAVSGSSRRAVELRSQFPYLPHWPSGGGSGPTRTQVSPEYTLNRLALCQLYRLLIRSNGSWQYSSQSATTTAPGWLAWDYGRGLRCRSVAGVRDSYQQVPPCLPWHPPERFRQYTEFRSADHRD